MTYVLVVSMVDRAISTLKIVVSDFQSATFCSQPTLSTCTDFCYFFRLVFINRNGYNVPLNIR